MSASFVSALSAAHDAAAGQTYPRGALYMVATPIGNLADITLRALHVLQLADAIACEDTRHTQQLLRAYGIERSGAQLLAVHQHNEAEAAEGVLARLREGQRIAYASDAGTPAVSDPGARLAAAVRAAGFRIVPLPGASSVTAALSAAGTLAWTEDAGGFLFAGFLPTKAGERAAALQALCAQRRPIVLLEAPHRIESLAKALAPLDERAVTIARELTKQFEEITTIRAGSMGAWLAENPQRTKGEFVVILHAPQDAAVDEQPWERVLVLLLAEMPLKPAVVLTAEITGAPRNAIYERALSLKRAGGGNP